MIYVLNKNKIYSYVVATFIVLGIFAFGVGLTPKEDVKLLKVSSNSINNDKNVNTINNITNIHK